MQTASNDVKAISWPRLAILGAADLWVLGRDMPNWSRLVAHLSEPQRWVQQVGTDRAASTLAVTLLWVAACWLALGITTAGASQLPGQLGRTASRATGRLMPRALQRLVVTAASASIAFSPVAALASTPAPVATPSQAIVLVLPTDGAPVRHVSSPAGEKSATTPPTATAPKPSTSKPTEPEPTASRTTALTAARTADQVVVTSGDSLWTITARQLGPRATPARIAAAWPRLYAANRRVIGRDPNLLRTAETLTVPASIEGQ